MKEYKLTFELVPDGCWYTNLRSVLPPKLWDKIRFEAYKKANGRCEICGVKTSRLEAHEIWNYDEKNALQTLEGITALCRRCHEVKHIGRTQLLGKGNDAMEHFMKVNGCSQSEYHETLGEANETHQRRNRIDGWRTDISWLKNKFDIQ